ncbi:MAG: TolC family protein [Firmicutes bacterium]|jgi:hypothetical protein|nr:TolC family protein [Bacillota bacterium]
MKHKPVFWLVLVVLVTAFASPASAEPIPISLKEAVDLAVAQNLGYQLALWEHELTSREQQLTDKTPTVNFSAVPIEARDGSINPAKGNVTINIPLGDHTTLKGILDVQTHKFEFEAKSKVGVTLDYDFFKPDSVEQQSPRDPLITLTNELILSVAGTLVSLNKQINYFALEEMRLAYLEEVHRAAVIKEQTAQIQQLKQQLYDTETKISDYKMSIKQQNIELNNLLNTAGINYLPVINPKEYQLEHDQQQLIDLALAASDQRSQALAAVERAENELSAVEASAGWSVTGTADLWWDIDFKQSPTWSVVVTANKSLYPPSLQKEKNELKLAQAQLRLAEIEKNTADQVMQLVQKLELLTAQRQQLEDDLAAAHQDLEISRKHLDVGLATELQLTEDQLELVRLQTNLIHNQYDQLIAVMQLMNLCGYDLNTLLAELVNEEG